MTKAEAITEMLKGNKVTHTYFTDEEWVAITEETRNSHVRKYTTEDGVEMSETEFWKYRLIDGWYEGWELWNENQPKNISLNPDVIKSVKGKKQKHKWKRQRGFQYIVRSRCEHCNCIRQKANGITSYQKPDHSIETTTEPLCLPLTVL